MLWLQSMTPQGLHGPAVSDRALTVFALLFMLVMAVVELPDGNAGLLLALTVAGWLPLLGRYRWPVITFLTVLAVESMHLVLVPLTEAVQFTSIPVATMVATYTIASRLHWRAAWLYGGAAALLLLVLGIATRDGDRLASSMFAFDLVLAATGAGVLVRNRHQRLTALERRAELAEQTKEEEARHRVASERLRMARELHDVVAHNLALVNAQSGVAAYLIRTDPEAAEKALENLTEHTRLALDELRSTVGLLREVTDSESPSVDGDVPDAEGLVPTPGLPNLPALIDRHAAMPGGVSLAVEGASRPMSTITALAAYRIIQESLTNARKHAPGAKARVCMTWHRDELEIKVSNDSPPPGGQKSAGDGTGHGLLGMRERALASRGTLTAAKQPDGGWQVTAHLPTDTADAGDTADQERP